MEHIPEKSQSRLQALKRIDEYERAGLFDRDVEADPPALPLLPDQIDYVNEKFSSKLKNRFANLCARLFFDGQIRKRNLVIEGVTGLENFLLVKDAGAILTCNHFNPFDNYALFKVIDKHLGGKSLWKVIREGNYTAFPGLYGFFFRHCNTLPLSSNFETMKLFMRAVKILLNRGEKILIYPEQGMWWNYRKPRPCKVGAFRFAAENGAPVLPCFITMSDSDKIGGDGFAIQAYTIHFLPPVYPDPNLSRAENALRMKTENEKAWKQIYESVYGIPLVYAAPEE